MAAPMLGGEPVDCRQIYRDYDRIRGLHKDDIGIPFWDIVVLTTADEAQKTAFEIQIRNKLERHEIPSGIPYLVYSDPPGPRAGCGGSTLYVIDKLAENYGEELYSKRVLLLNAGGQSQRLPSSSALGKIFMALPLGSPPYTLLDIKLASYLPLLTRMNPGIFHAASDTIEVYDLGKDSDWTFCQPGFTALAHPSSLEIGRTHGVYILEEHTSKGKETHLQNSDVGPEGETTHHADSKFNSKREVTHCPNSKLGPEGEKEQKTDGSSRSTKAEMKKCLKVLQKPSIKLMKEEGAVIKTGEGSDIVYTDSCFFFDHHVTWKLLEFYKKEAPLECEIDSYGDFLQALGRKADIGYTKDTVNVSKVEPKLVDTREKIFHTLRNTELNILLLHSSRFYHLGTFQEYLYHLCQDKVLSREIGCSRLTFSKIEKSEQSAEKRKKMTIDGCVIQSILTEGSFLPASSIIEYSMFKCPIQLGTDCVISNIKVDEIDVVIQIPDGIFLHTLPISVNGLTSYVTVFQHVNDNVKKKVSKDNSKNLTFLQVSLQHVAAMYGLENAADFLADNSSVMCLWEAQLFPVCPTESKSFLQSLNVVQSVIMNQQVSFSEPRMSFADIVCKKNIHQMLSFRTDLWNQIK